MHHGDFRGDLIEVLAQHFDALFYTANWGSRQLAFRFPISAIHYDLFRRFALSETIGSDERRTKTWRKRSSRCLPRSRLALLKHPLPAPLPSPASTGALFAKARRIQSDREREASESRRSGLQWRIENAKLLEGLESK